MTVTKGRRMDRRKFVKGITLGAGAAAALGGGMPLKGADGSENKCRCSDPKLCGGKTPVESIHNSQKARNGVAVGGIGTGSAELRMDGLFYNWQIFNNLPLGTGKPIAYQPDSMLFFLLRYQIENREPRIKALMVNNEDDLASINSVNQYNTAYIYPWLSGVDAIESVVQFPFVRMKYVDSEMPVDVEMEVFSPFIPGDVRNSSLPAMLFRFDVKSKIDAPVTVTLAANLRTGAGYDFHEKLYTSMLKQKPGCVLHTSGVSGIAETESSFGTQTLGSLAGDTTWRAGWDHTHPHYEQFLRSAVLPNLDTTNPVEGKGGRNVFDRRLNKVNGLERSFSTLAVTRNLKKGDGFEHHFVHAWNFPNLYNHRFDRVEGHYYSNFFKDSETVADHVIANRTELTGKTRTFVDDFFASTLEPAVLNQVNSHLNTFITSSWLTKSGDFGVLEGMNCNDSCCGFTTIDVSVYGTTLIVSLFPELQKASMRLHRDLQQPDGKVAHSYMKDFNHHPEQVADLTERLDVAMQYAVLVIRDYLWTNDRAYLDEMWPSVKKAMDYMLARDTDGDRMPDMEGIMCSYDNFPMYGLASYIQSQWLCALAMCAEAAKALGDAKAAGQYGRILEKGRKLLDERLWNGSYFRLYSTSQRKYTTEDGTGEKIETEVPPKDEGCLTDQLIGQWVSRMSGLGDIADRGKIQSALRSILRHSFTPDIGLKNCSWPGDTFLHDIPWDIWVDQANTPWTGVELAFASFLIYEGLVEEAMQVIRLVDKRYRRAGLYWNHQECGGHYYRAMSAWTIMNAFLGLTVNRGRLGFSPKIQADEYKVLFAVNGATAHFIRKSGQVAIDVRSGRLEFNTLVLDPACLPVKKPGVRITGTPAVSPVSITRGNGEVRIGFGKMVAVEAGRKIEIG
jgi:non-lysosomal glucosylceramidase